MTDPKNIRPRSRRLPVQIPITHANINLFLESEIMNLSKGGVFIHSDISLPIGSEIEFQFTLPGSDRVINALGTVVWSRQKGASKKPIFPDHPSGMGIQFKKIDVDDLDFILDQIERLLKNL